MRRKLTRFRVQAGCATPRLDLCRVSASHGLDGPLRGFESHRRRHQLPWRPSFPPRLAHPASSAIFLTARRVGPRREGRRCSSCRSAAPSSSCVPHCPVSLVWGGRLCSQFLRLEGAPLLHEGAASPRQRGGERGGGVLCRSAGPPPSRATHWPVSLIWGRGVCAVGFRVLRGGAG